MSKKLVFLCGARDFHAMDWYRSAKELLNDVDISIATDLIAGEGFEKIIKPDDKLYKLLILDYFLFRNQSALGDKWRNILKLLVLPIQVFLLWLFSKKNPSAIYHAHSMYYLVLARLAGVNYIGTPQGSDILVKPLRSKFYYSFAKFGLLGAKHITVDSKNMQAGVNKICSRDAMLIQNGIDIKFLKEITNNFSNNDERNGLLSIRGFTELYQIHKILDARNNSTFGKSPITFIYPFHEDIYKAQCSKHLQPLDKDLGRVPRDVMYNLMLSAELIISIPESDSSPRSVYESVFCGAAVAIEYNSYYELLPECMKKRIIIVKTADKDWFDKAIISASEILKNKYTPSAEALKLFDQRESFKILEKLLFE